MAAYYTFEDHSGMKASSKTYDNPYDALIDQCNNDPAQIQAAYSKHRVNRNAQQKDKLLAPAFERVTVDEILAKLEDPAQKDFRDPRHCLVFWTRPTARVQDTIEFVQRRLRSVLPNLWLMPRDNQHMTALEVTHSLTAPEIETLVNKLSPAIAAIADTPLTPEHRARLVKPLLSFDAQAFALSFLPAAGEPGNASNDAYSYHHLRRDLYAQVAAAGVPVDSRYVVPSAHLTIGRYITTQDLETEGALDRSKVAKLVQVIEEINQDLEAKYWSDEWLVSSERGITCRKGMLWYGGGETVYQSKGY